MGKQGLIKKIQQFEQTYLEIEKELESHFTLKQLAHIYKDFKHFKSDVSDFEWITTRALEQSIKEEEKNE